MLVALEERERIEAVERRGEMRRLIGGVNSAFAAQGKADDAIAVENRLYERWLGANPWVDGAAAGGITPDEEAIAGHILATIYRGSGNSAPAQES